MKSLHQTLKDQIELIPRDKKLHFKWGLGLTLLGVFSPWLLSVGVLAGIGREVYNYYIEGSVEVEDIAYTWAGAAPIICLLSIMWSL